MVFNKIKKTFETKSNLVMVIFCAIVALVFAIPMLNNEVNLGSDVLFHVNRIDSLVYAIKNGDFFPRVLFNQNFNFGYGSPMFYSIFFLYIPALLQLAFGILPLISYRILLLLIAFFSAISIYICVSKIVNKNSIVVVMFVTFLYVCSPGFLKSIYITGALGDALAYVFMPVILLGIYQVLYGDDKKWWLLIIGYSGLLLSHNITFLLMCIVFFFLIIIKVPSLINDKRRVIHIIYAAIITFFLTAFYTLPMIEQLSTNYYRVNEYFGTSALAENTIKYNQIFKLSVTDNIFMHIGIGFSYSFLPALVFFTPKCKEKKFAMICSIMGYICIMGIMEFFPWKYLTFLSFLQWPSRLLTPANVLLIIPIAYGLINIDIKKNIRSIIIGLICIECAFETVSTEFYLIKTCSGISLTDTSEQLAMSENYYENFNTWYNVVEVSSPEYLVRDSNIHYYNEYHSYLGGRRIISNKEDDLYEFDESNYNSLIFTKTTVSEGTIYVLPKEYYKGYYIDCILIENQSEEYLGQIETFIDPLTGNVSFNAQRFDGPGTIVFNLVYKGTFVQKISMVISIASLLLVTLFVIYKKIKKAS